MFEASSVFFSSPLRHAAPCRGSSVLFIGTFPLCRSSSLFLRTDISVLNPFAAPLRCPFVRPVLAAATPAPSHLASVSFHVPLLLSSSFHSSMRFTAPFSIGLCAMLPRCAVCSPLQNGKWPGGGGMKLHWKPENTFHVCNDVGMCNLRSESIWRGSVRVQSYSTIQE